MLPAALIKWDSRVCGGCSVSVCRFCVCGSAAVLRMKDVHLDEWDKGECTASVRDFDLCFCLSSERAMKANRQTVNMMVWCVRCAFAWGVVLRAGADLRAACLFVGDC